MNKKRGCIFCFIMLLGLSLLIVLIYYNSNLNNKTTDSNSTTTTLNSNITTNYIEKSNIEYETLYDNKKLQVPVLVFYGNGCDKCDQLFQFLDSLDDNVKNKFIVYKYNVWSNSENKKLMYNVGSILETKIYGIPFIVIGRNYYKGYNESNNNDIVSSISDLYQRKDFSNIVE